MGVVVSRHFQSPSAILESISSYLENELSFETSGVQITSPDAFTVELHTQDGFKYSIGSERIYVSFTHHMKAKAISGGPPIMELLSSPAPYTDLLEMVSERLAKILHYISSNQRSIKRIGVVSTTQVDFDLIPPGILEYIERLTDPWGHDVDEFKFNLTANTRRTEQWTERCIHSIVRPENREELTSLAFDWQRILKNPRALKSGSVNSLFADAKKSALNYFEEIAIGGFSYGQRAS